jgi:1-deoxy-D-xylulose-5-phosphate synthase
MAKHGYSSSIKILGIPDSVVEHGTPKQLQEECGFDANAIAKAARDMMNQRVDMKSLLQ